MPFAQITITDGQVSGVDNLGPAASSVVNWEIDDAGINLPRSPLTTYAVSGIGTSPMLGVELWGNYVVWADEARYVTTISTLGPTTANIVSTATSSTQIEGSALRYTFVSGQDNIYIAGGGRIQYWNDTRLTTAVISASPSCTHIASLGQYLIANDTSDTSIFKWSDIGEGAWGTWPAANFTSAEARPDPIVGLFENLNELQVFGSSTLQTYTVGTDPTLPFDVVATMNVGLAAPYAVTRLDDSLVFFDDRLRVVVSDGRSVRSISDAIQKDLRGLTTINDAWMYREERGQFSHLVIRFPTESRTFAYNLKAQHWTERDYYAAPFHDDFPVGAYVYWPANNLHLFSSTLPAGGLLQMGTGYGAEIGGALVAERVTGWHNHGSDNRKRSVRLRVTMRRGTGTVNTTPGAFEIRVQNDDGPWSEWQQVSAGEPHQYQHVQDVFLGGIFRRRRYNLRFSNVEQFSLVSLTDEVMELPA